MGVAARPCSALGIRCRWLGSRSCSTWIGHVGEWLANQRPHWVIHSAAAVGLAGLPDHDVFVWAQREGAIVVTFDEDFTDQRSFPVGSHLGIVRLRVVPTTVAATQGALSRLLQEAEDDQLPGSLVVVTALRIRLRRV